MTLFMLCFVGECETGVLHKQNFHTFRWQPIKRDETIIYIINYF